MRVRQRLHGKAGQGHDGHAHHARSGAGHGGDQGLCRIRERLRLRAQNRGRDRGRIQNAARYLTGAAQGDIGGTNSYDNRKTYNQNASTTIQVDKLMVRDEQDVCSLAIEIAGLTKRLQRGKGMKFA